MTGDSRLRHERRIRRAKTNPHNVAAGQHWLDNDPREGGKGRRFIKVLSVDGIYATVQTYRMRTEPSGKRVPAYGRTSRIRLDRFRPSQNGYRRVS